MARPLIYSHNLRIHSSDWWLYVPWLVEAATYVIFAVKWHHGVQTTFTYVLI